MEKIFLCILFLSSILVICNPVYSASSDRKILSEEYSPEGISSFIKKLINDGEYYRAHAELARLEEYYPGYISPLCFHVTDSYILFKSGRYNEILNNKREISDEETLCAINVFRIDSIMKAGSYNDDRLHELCFSQQCTDDGYTEYYKKRQLYSSIFKSFNDDSEFILSDNMEYRDSYEYASKLSEEKKSPFLGAFSGIIPGMGYIYAGETGTGVVAFIVIAAGAAITFGAHANNLEPLAAVSGAATFFMYAGSIAGGYMQTVRYNRKLSEKLVVRFDRDFMLDKDRDDIYIKCGLESNVR